jgi:type IV fimbrial biogenesis protein FimT
MLTGPTVRRKAHGFTLIELMISVVVLAILTSVAMPSFRIWLLNIQVRNAAESILSGIQRARAEAVGRNTNVSFVIGTDSSWTINVLTPASVIETRPTSDGSVDVSRTELPDGATMLTFSNLGLITPNANGSASLTQIDFSAGTGSQSLRVMIGAGGSAKMCKPSAC